jgi:hypothetical protein
MGGRVATIGYTIHSRGDDFITAYDYGSKGASPIAYIVYGQFYGPFHPFLVHTSITLFVMIRFVVEDRHGTINLLRKDEAYHLM